MQRATIEISLATHGDPQVVPPPTHYIVCAVLCCVAVAIPIQMALIPITKATPGDLE